MVPEWLPYVALNIISVSIGLTLAKWATDKLKMDSLTVSLGGMLAATALYFPIFFSSLGAEPELFPSAQSTFYLLISIIINAVAFIFFIKALKSGDLSIIGPLENLRPVFVVLLAMLILGESFQTKIFAGAAIVAAGAFIVHLKNNFSETVNGIFKSKVSFYMLAMAFLYGLAVNVDKLALASFSHTKYTFYIILGMTAIYSAVYIKSKKPFKDVLNKWSVAFGILYAIALWGIFAALKLASPSIITPVQMLRTIFIALVGMIIFGEKNVKLRIIGGLIMLAGVWIVLS